jgi:DnaJ-class molecular chaperone
MAMIWFFNLLLDFPTAALGGTVEIPTVEGSAVKNKNRTWYTTG